MSAENRSVLVTGGCGAIGVNLVHRLVNEGQYSVHILDNLSSGNNDLPPNVDFTNFDIGNNEKLAHFFSDYRPRYIYHLAAHFANQNSVDHPLSDTEGNIIGLINILELQKSNANLEKFVFASSSCVYGNSEFMSEDDEVSPYDTPYAINKYAGELYCKYYADIHNLPVVSARIFNNFGPGELPGPYRNVIPNFILKALHDEDIPITGTGDETRDFNYVDNTVDLLVRLAESEYRSAEIFNSGTGKGTSIRDLAEAIIDVTNSSSIIRYTEQRGWDHVKHRRANVEKSSTLLGYEPRVDFRRELEETVAWIRSKLNI